MIAMLTGTLVRRDLDGGVVNVGGVGYRVHIPQTTLAALPPAGGDVTLDIYTAVREDAIELFGFVTEYDRQVFVKLISVNGVGPKLGLSCLSHLSADDIVAAVVRGDVRALQGVKGVGKKTAERLVLELRDGFKKMSRPGTAQPAVDSKPIAGSPAELDDLHSVLSNLGYGPADADRVVSQLRSQIGTLSFEGLVKEALRILNG